MLIIISVLITLTALVVILSTARARSVNASLGWMSQQWLAEHRASHSE